MVKAPYFGSFFSLPVAVPHPTRLTPGHLPPGGRVVARHRWQWEAPGSTHSWIPMEYGLSRQCAHWLTMTVDNR